jgi:hypothetical protein
MTVKTRVKVQQKDKVQTSHSKNHYCIQTKHYPTLHAVSQLT